MCAARDDFAVALHGDLLAGELQCGEQGGDVKRAIERACATVYGNPDHGQIVARKIPGSKRGISALTAALLVFAAQPSSADCPQQRSTLKAPDDLYTLSNPEKATAEGIAAGRKLYEKAANPACEVCHGLKGDGNGAIATQFLPRPRDFTCADVLHEIPDGQLFWIIRNGSPETGMPPYKKLTDSQIWQIILYLRTFAKAK